MANIIVQAQKNSNQNIKQSGSHTNTSTAP